MMKKNQGTRLTNKNCAPCRGGVAPLKGDQLNSFLGEVPKWEAMEQHHLVRSFPFEDFKSALQFVNKIGDLAEEEWHHPDLGLAWGKVDIKIYTHKINGLSENDFILAAKIDRLFELGLDGEGASSG